MGWCISVPLSSQTSSLFLLRSFCPPAALLDKTPDDHDGALSCVTHICAAPALTGCVAEASPGSPGLCGSTVGFSLFQARQSQILTTILGMSLGPVHQFQGTYFKASLTGVGLSEYQSLTAPPKGGWGETQSMATAPAQEISSPAFWGSR